MITESKFLRITFSLARFIEDSFKNSKMLFLLLSFLDFLEKSFLNSFTLKICKKTSVLFYFKKIWNILDSLNERFKNSMINEINIFNPVFIFPITYFAFLSISSYKLSNLALISIFLGISFFILGIIVSKKIKFKEVYLGVYKEKIAFLLLTVGIFALMLDLHHAKAIPLLDPLARRNLSVLYTYLASLIVPGGILVISIVGTKMRKGEISLREARMFSLIALFTTTFLISLLGYRTQTIVGLVGSIAAMYFMNIIGLAEIFVSLFVVLFSISALGYFRALAQGSAIGFFEVIGKRVGLTLSVYDHLVERFWLFGANKGSVALATFSSFFHSIPGPRLGPRTIVARVIGVEENISITPTLLGTVVLDFGLAGVIFFMLSLGFIIGLAYNAMKQTKNALSTAIYSLLIAYILVGIETGLVDLNVFFFFAGGFLILLKSIK